MEQKHYNMSSRISTPEMSVVLYQEITSNVDALNAIAVIVPASTQNVKNEQQLRIDQATIIAKLAKCKHRIFNLVSGSIDCDSDDIDVRRLAEEELLQQLRFANHFNTSAMIRLPSMEAYNLARIVNNCVIRNPILMVVPIAGAGKQDKKCSVDDSWTWWNRFRSAVDYHPKIGVALELSVHIPSEAELKRWIGEPVVLVIVPSDLFIGDRHTVLSVEHKTVLKAFARNNVGILVTSFSLNGHMTEFPHYVRHLYRNAVAEIPIHEFNDYIGVPLQPLHDNLDANTYEVFEKDPVKYSKYQQAMERALVDMVAEADKSTRTVVVMVVGAGRGPLVRAVLNAAMNKQRKIKIYVVEKNLCAIIALTALIEELWSDKDIQLFPCDMRDFEPPEKVDILVSELLGAFGDNELSPECLDGAQKHLQPHGISIPSRYTSYVNPIMSSRLYNLVRHSAESQHPRAHGQSHQTSMEQMCTVFLNNVFHIDEPRPVFTFVHPNRSGKPIDNRRFTKLRFTVSLAAVLHGFAGYFDAILYDDIVISINPKTLSTGMFSWFPVFFPITEPIQLKAGDTVQVHFWRDVSRHKVWYEWCVTEPTLTHIHNQGGRYSSIHM